MNYDETINCEIINAEINNMLNDELHASFDYPIIYSEADQILIAQDMQSNTDDLPF